MLAKQAAEKLFAATVGRGLDEGHPCLAALSRHVVGGWEMPTYRYFGGLVLIRSSSERAGVASGQRLSMRPAAIKTRV
jgi:hypothetical protein